MRLAAIPPPRYFVASNENAEGHNLTLTAASVGKTAKGSVWPTLAVQRHIYFPAGSGPTFAVGAGAGTGATVSSLPVTPNDALLPLKLVTGTSPSAGTLVTVTFAAAYPNNDICNLITPLDSKAAGLQLMAPASGTGTTLTITCNVAPAASTTYAFALLLVGLY